MIAGRLEWTRGRFGVWYTKEVMRVSQAVGLGVGLSPQGPLGAAEGEQEIEETKEMLERKGKARGWRVQVEGG